MSQALVGYARCLMDEQDVAAQQAALLQLGVAPERIYLDRGFAGPRRPRPGLDEALAAVEQGDTLVVSSLDRLARSIRDARAIGDTLIARGVRLQLGAIVQDPSEPHGEVFFDILATLARFEADLVRLQVQDGMDAARKKGKYWGKRHKLSVDQQQEMRRLHASGDYSIVRLTELFSVSRPTVYRVLQIQSAPATAK